MKNHYQELRDRQQEEVNAFPIQAVNLKRFAAFFAPISPKVCSI